jgi:hypothetical protein
MIFLSVVFDRRLTILSKISLYIGLVGEHGEKGRTPLGKCNCNVPTKVGHTMREKEREREREREREGEREKERGGVFLCDVVLNSFSMDGNFD